MNKLEKFGLYSVLIGLAFFISNSGINLANWLSIMIGWALFTYGDDISKWYAERKARW